MNLVHRNFSITEKKIKQIKMNSAGLEESLVADNICAIIVSYNPDEKLIDNINALGMQVKEIIVIDNCSQEPASLQIIGELEKTKNVLIIKNNSNEGIAAALNTGILASIDRGYYWTLQMDQDSMPLDNMVSEICKAGINYNNSNLGMIGINYSVNGTPLVGATKQKSVYKNVLTLITSGTLISNNAFLKAGNYREDFFIDSVDFEYCLRLNQNGFKCILTTALGMTHQLGRMKNKSFLGVRLKSTNHPAIRRFYMARNNIILTRLYLKHFPLWILKKNFFFILSVILMLLIDTDKTEKLKAVMNGVKEGIRYKSSQ